MSDNSHIEWTDATWNPTTGCTKVSPGCANCYIAGTPPFRMAGRKFDEKGHIPIKFHSQRLSQPLRWRKTRLVFVNSLSDLFHEDIPDAFVVRVYGVMVAAYWHVFQVLTKRPERRRQLLSSPEFREAVAAEAARQINMLRGKDPLGSESSKSLAATLNLARWQSAGNGRAGRVVSGAAANIWEGATVENQHFADERIPVLLDTPAAVRFLSCEPLLGPVDLNECGGLPWVEPKSDDMPYAAEWRGVDWVIVGGESGPGARPMDVAWMRSVVKQCLTAGVPVFVKQLGSVVQVDASSQADFMHFSAKSWNQHGMVAALKDRKGGDPDEWPSDLRVRQFPGQVVRP